MGAACCKRNPDEYLENSVNPNFRRRGSRLTTRKQSVLGTNMSKNTDYKRRFEYVKILGKGSFGKVRLFRDKIWKKIKLAIKSVPKENLKSQELVFLQSEVKTLSQLDHPNIVKYYETYEDDKSVHICMMHIQGEDLLNVIMNKKHYRIKEEQAARITFNLLSALKFLSSFDVVHRDVKPQNILFAEQGNYDSVKLIDFGLSTTIAAQDYTQVGSPYFMAPELIKGVCSETTDLWSVGVILHALISGAYPFVGESQSEIFDKISKVIFRGTQLKKVRASEEAIDLVQQMLVKDHHKRVKLEEAMNHSWFAKFDLKTSFKLVDKAVVQSMKKFSREDSFIRELYKKMVYIKDEKEMKDIVETFKTVDRGNKGFIELEEFSQYLLGIEGSLEESEIKFIFDSVNSQREGKLTVSEFTGLFFASYVYF